MPVAGHVSVKTCWVNCTDWELPADQPFIPTGNPASYSQQRIQNQHRAILVMCGVLHSGAERLWGTPSSRSPPNLAFWRRKSCHFMLQQFYATHDDIRGFPSASMVHPQFGRRYLAGQLSDVRGYPPKSWSDIFGMVWRSAVHGGSGIQSSSLRSLNLRIHRPPNECYRALGIKIIPRRPYFTFSQFMWSVRGTWSWLTSPNTSQLLPTLSYLSYPIYLILELCAQFQLYRLFLEL
jgi:hypothetical protein